MGEPFDIAMSADHSSAGRALLPAAELADVSRICAHASVSPDVALRVVEATAGVRFY